MAEPANVNMDDRSIPFTQFLRPDGRRQEVRTTDASYTDDDLKAAQAIIDVGFRFEIEQLMTGQISMTISDSDADYVHQICANNTDVPASVKKLIHKHDIETLMAMRDREAEEGESDEPAF